MTYADDLARIPSLTDPEARRVTRRMVAALTQAKAEAEAANLAEVVLARRRSRPAAALADLGVSLGVFGLLAG